ncbi:hypothetical protein SAMN05192539_102347 [Paraburkholderia diazotrophica]|uniref:Uncharacterized protein n=1 Tax=Paraburkholderia diazotrophica TaxID=667676 RepID=A0A1H7CZG8_9BURK|nr:hypothetical protein SAMN05192539_102347 [Paraburkholderia diazotrophica]
MLDGPKLKHIAPSRHGADRPLTVVAQSAAYFADARYQRVVGYHAVAPHRFDEFVTGQEATQMQRQVFQQREGPGSESNRAPRDELAPIDVDLTFGVAQHAGHGGRRCCPFRRSFSIHPANVVYADALHGYAGPYHMENMCLRTNR